MGHTPKLGLLTSWAASTLHCVTDENSPTVAAEPHFEAGTSRSRVAAALLSDSVMSGGQAPRDICPVSPDSRRPAVDALCGSGAMSGLLRRGSAQIARVPAIQANTIRMGAVCIENLSTAIVVMKSAQDGA